MFVCNNVSGRIPIMFSRAVYTCHEFAGRGRTSKRGVVSAKWLTAWTDNDVVFVVGCIPSAGPRVGPAGGGSPEVVNETGRLGPIMSNSVVLCALWEKMSLFTENLYVVYVFMMLGCPFTSSLVSFHIIVTKQKPQT